MIFLTKKFIAFSAGALSRNRLSSDSDGWGKLRCESIHTHRYTSYIPQFLQAIKQQRVEYVFGIVGIPIIEVLSALVTFLPSDCSPNFGLLISSEDIFSFAFSYLL